MAILERVHRVKDQVKVLLPNPEAKRESRKLLGNFNGWDSYLGLYSQQYWHPLLSFNCWLECLFGVVLTFQSAIPANKGVDLEELRIRLLKAEFNSNLEENVPQDCGAFQ